MKKISILIATLALAAGVLAGCAPLPFVNPGDFLGGGGTGDAAEGADDVTEDVKEDFSDSDFSDLSGDVSSEGATVAEPTAAVYPISASGTYLFRGSYGGIRFTEKNLHLHLIFDGAEIVSDGIAIDGSEKSGAEVVLTLSGENSVRSASDSENAIHVKGKLSLNGSGSLSVASEGKNAVKVSKDFAAVDCSLTLTAKSHGIAARSISASDCKITVLSAGKDGLNAECDDETTAFTTGEGYVYLKDADYTCAVEGDGIQADTVVYLNGGNYHIKTQGTFVPKSQMAEYGLAADDFKYVLQNGVYKRIASDETGRYGANSLYGLKQGCKGIKVGEIEYTNPRTRRKKSPSPRATTRLSSRTAPSLSTARTMPSMPTAGISPCAAGRSRSPRMTTP